MYVWFFYLFLFLCLLLSLSVKATVTTGLSCCLSCYLSDVCHSVNRSSFFLLLIICFTVFFFYNLACLSHCREFYGSNLFLPSSFNFIFSNSLFNFPAVPRAQKLMSPLEITQRYQRFSLFRDDVPSLDFIYLLSICMTGDVYLT